MKIRTATHGDKTEVITMARAAHEAAALPYQFSPEHVSALFAICVFEPHRMLCLIAEADDGAAAGFLMASASTYHLGDFKVATELAFWIGEAHRGGRAAFRMLESYEAWAHKQGCVMVDMVALADNPRAGQLYERRNYRQAETHYLKRLD